MRIARRRALRTAGRGGFTLVELLVAVSIGGILMTAVYQVLVTNERVSAVQRERVLSQQTVRAGVDLLAQELREVSVAGGDLLAISEDSVAFRALRTLGVVCTEGSTNLDVAAIGHPFREMRDVFVLIPGDPAAGTTTGWQSAGMNDIPAPADCPDEFNLDAAWERQRLVIQDIGEVIPVGAIVRAFENMSYHVAAVDGDRFLVRTQDGETAQLVGPLESGDGLGFTYLDTAGNETADPDQVARVRITLRTLPGIRDDTGRQVADSLSTVVHLRN